MFQIGENLTPGVFLNSKIFLLSSLLKYFQYLNTVTD